MLSRDPLARRSVGLIGKLTIVSSALRGDPYAAGTGALRPSSGVLIRKDPLVNLTTSEVVGSPSTWIPSNSKVPTVSESETSVNLKNPLPIC